MRNGGSVIIVALGLMGLVAATSPALSQMNCNPRAGYPPGLNRNKHFAGLFRIPFHPPDLQDPAAVKRHAVLANVWGRILWDEMRARTRGLCMAWFEVQGFPDSRVSLIVNGTANRIDGEKSFCRGVLQDILGSYQPSDERIKNAVEWLEDATQPPHLLAGEVQETLAMDALNVSLAILPLIYERNSLLHALVSVGTIDYSAVSAMELRAWIQSQRSPEPPLLEEMPHCLQQHGDLASSDDVPDARSKSGILPPGEIHLSRNSDWLLPPGPLRYAVVVGNPVEPPAGLLPLDLTEKYCSQDHTFTVKDDAPPFPPTVRLRCDPIFVFDLDAWIMIRCDPNDCTSERVDRAVARAIAADPKIQDLARRSSNTGLPRGPYLIVIR
jgi:hypothetical protein